MYRELLKHKGVADGGDCCGPAYSLLIRFGHHLWRARLVTATLENIVRERNRHCDQGNGQELKYKIEMSICERAQP
jgi:hypothetical protein